MMKFIFLVIFMNFMLFNKKIWMCYNLCFLSGGGLLLLYMFKDMLNNNISMNFGSSYYSIFLIVLSIWITGLMLMSMNSFNWVLDKLKLNIFFMLLLILMMFFMTLDLLMFYFFFEVSMIPTFFLIIYWGSNPERISAAFYMMMYMLMASFPLLVYIFDMYKYVWSMKINLMILLMKDYPLSVWGSLMIFMAFYIKMPIYMFHIWLPKAHVEAPVYGSMILAGVLLKMGSYGIIRFLEMLGNKMNNYLYLIFSVSIVGSVLTSLICLIQLDMKSLVAYSSVVHMNLMLCSMVTMWKLGILSAYIMMVAHGLCSSGLFFMVNLYYDRTGSRLLMLNKGMLNKLPNLTLWWFLLCVSNFSYPFSLNFLSELLMLMVMMNWNFMFLWYLMIICFMSSGYSLYLYSYLQYGSGEMDLENKFSGNMIKEYLILIIHIYPLLLILMNMIMFM